MGFIGIHWPLDHPDRSKHAISFMRRKAAVLVDQFENGNGRRRVIVQDRVHYTEDWNPHLPEELVRTNGLGLPTPQEIEDIRRHLEDGPTT